MTPSLPYNMILGIWCALGFVRAGASYQVSVCSLQTLLNTKARLLVKLPVHTSSYHRSSCRTAAVVWARSRLEHLGKIACGHRDNNCMAWASLWRIIISFKEILGSEWARFLARAFCVFQSSNPKAFLCQWNIIEHSGRKLFRSNVSISHAPRGPAWQRSKGWPSTAKQQTKRRVYTNLEQLICCQKQKAERTPGWKELAVSVDAAFLSPLRSACLIESSWWGFWAEMCGSSQRDSGSRSHSGYLSCAPWFCFRTHVNVFIQAADISYCKWEESLTARSS